MSPTQNGPPCKPTITHHQRGPEFEIMIYHKPFTSLTKSSLVRQFTIHFQSGTTHWQSVKKILPNGQPTSNTASHSVGWTDMILTIVNLKQGGLIAPSLFHLQSYLHTNLSTI